MSFYGTPQHWRTIPNRRADEDAFNANSISFFSMFIFGTRFLVCFRAGCDLCARTARSEILRIIL